MHTADYGGEGGVANQPFSVFFAKFKILPPFSPLITNNKNDKLPFLNKAFLFICQFE